MTKEEILEGNKLIAEFMGFTVGEFGFQEPGEEWQQPFKHLKYHSSWDWLMPVVEKIETLGYGVKIHGIQCSVNRLLEDETIVQYVCGDVSKKIELVHMVIVEFIQWYNLNK